MADRRAVAYVGVGSNIEPEASIVAAFERLAARVRVAATSTFYRTEPLGRPGQQAFLNGVWRIETAIEPRPLKFEVLRPIEEALGRRRGPDRYEPRTIDLDILLYGEVAMAETDLRIPDPDLRVRPFLAIPLLELDPAIVLPDTGERLASLVDPADRRGLVPAPELTAALRARAGGAEARDPANRRKD